jgi:glycerophosphoryl diester phosphodiesterase
MRLSLYAPLDRWLAPAPHPGRVDWLGGTFFAHRGLHGAGLNGAGGAPENSLAAAAAAVARGFGIECDVQLTADDEAVVFHDFTLARMTGERGAVIDRTAAALSAMSLTGSGETIPSLNALLDAVAGQAPLLIELKSRRDWPIARLCAAVARSLAGYRGAHAVMSFDPRAPAWFARHSAATPRGLIVSEEGRKGWRHSLQRHLALWRARPDFLACDIRDLPSPFAAMQRRRGLPIASWTVRSPALLARADVHADAPIAEGAGVPPTVTLPRESSGR